MFYPYITEMTELVNVCGLSRASTGISISISVGDTQSKADIEIEIYFGEPTTKREVNITKELLTKPSTR